ncbi:hypothetical protein C9I28_14740 [Pseudoduganella armeniaca]|uniref:Lipoprotein n=2 Tax=Pseudoduganella armeniaca TaxID=2072590 RepID=A0A2R4CBB6_9BURK|nr:hypothetical protein C9I28_14740 [Pseudoduganella armeniaca]
MLKRALLLVLPALLSACTELPAAKLQLIDLRLAQGGYAVTFDSDVDFLGYYEEGHRWRPAVNKKLVCSLAQPPNFDVANYDKEAASGNMELVSARQVGNRSVFRYKALLFFERWESGSSMSFGSGDYVDRLLPPASAMPCKVRILILFGIRYLSETLYLPTDPLKQLARQLAREDAPAHGEADER